MLMSAPRDHLYLNRFAACTVAIAIVTLCLHIHRTVNTRGHIPLIRKSKLKVVVYVCIISYLYFILVQTLALYVHAMCCMYMQCVVCTCNVLYVHAMCCMYMQCDVTNIIIAYKYVCHVTSSNMYIGLILLL